MVTGNRSKNEKDIEDYGIIYLSGSIEEDSSERICTHIIEYNISGKVDYIQMIINSAGGSSSAGFAIIDMMEWSRLPIYTTGIGIIASMGLMIFMAGKMGQRIITPRTSILSHHFSTVTMGNYSQLLSSRKQQDFEHERIINHYLRYTGIKTKEELEQTLLCDVDKWLTPKEALSYKIADAINSMEKNA